MRFLITGIGGFAGGHLARFLAERGDVVCGVTRDPESAAQALALLRQISPGAGADAVVVADVCDRAALHAAVEQHRPDGIFHLAAQSSVSAGEADPAATFATNTLGTVEVLTAARAGGRSCRVLVVSSAECYGRAAGGQPLDESTPLRPLSVYAASKVAAEVLMRQAVDAYGDDAVCVRAFNHTGPGQAPHFVCADFARQIAAIERGAQKTICVGNIEAVRDFLDVRDVVRAYALVWERAERGSICNVSTGVGRRIRDILDLLRSLARVPVSVETDPQRLRAADIPVLIGDNRRIRELGWKPQIAWETTLRDLLESVRQG